MKRNKDVKEIVDRHLELHSALPLKEMVKARERLIQRLRAEPAGPWDKSMMQSDWSPFLAWARLAMIPTAAAAVILTVIVAITFRPDAFATVESIDGALYRVIEGNPRTIQVGQTVAPGEVVRSESVAGGTLKLVGGSRVEMRSQSELFLEPSDGGIRVRLVRGGVIVSAAKQGRRLAVTTKDVTASVVGTVFLVGAEREGSRVAVIQGEVQVQHSATAKNLLPGEQVATGSMMVAHPVESEISWSRNAEVHMAMLQQAKSESGRAAPAPLEFAGISIRPFPFESPENGPPGLACHGIDGTRRATFDTSASPAPTPRGRCMGNNVPLGKLIEFAYDMPYRYGPDVPHWALVGTGTSSGLRNGIREPSSRFRVEGIAEDVSSATTEQLRRMLQTALVDRFKLRFRRETQEVSGYALAVERNGSKLKRGSGDGEPLSVDFSNTGSPVLRGRSTIEEFIQFIAGFIALTDGIPIPIVDRTGLAGVYDYEFFLPVPGGGGGRGGPTAGQLTAPASDSDRRSWRGPAMAAALEDQLGLLLQAEKRPIEILMIESVEKPAAN